MNSTGYITLNNVTHPQTKKDCLLVRLCMAVSPNIRIVHSR